MKKLLLAFVVMASVGYDASAMIFKRDRTVALPVVDDIKDAEWSPQASQDWFGPLKKINDRTQEELSILEIGAKRDLRELEVLAQKNLRGLEKKITIKILCDAFKKDCENVRNNHKNPVMTYETHQLDREKWNGTIKFEHELCDYNFNETMKSLKKTKKIIERDLKNISWFQWLWNRGAYKNYQKSIQVLDNEIALHEDRDRHMFNLCTSRGLMILNSQSVFNRSSMPRSMYEDFHLPARE